MNSAPLVRKPELSRLCGINVYKIERLTQNRAIPCIRLGHSSVYYDVEAVRAALARRTVREVGR